MGGTPRALRRDTLGKGVMDSRFRGNDGWSGMRKTPRRYAPPLFSKRGMREGTEALPYGMRGNAGGNRGPSLRNARECGRAQRPSPWEEGNKTAEGCKLLVFKML